MTTGNQLTVRNRVQIPSLKASLAPLIKSSFVGVSDYEGYWVKPKTITSQQRKDISEHLHEMRKNFPAATPEHLKARVSTLLAHYFHNVSDVNVSKMIAVDWLASLSSLPKECLDKALNYWRDNETRKPKPADIRKLAVDYFGAREWEKIERLKEAYNLPIFDNCAEIGDLLREENAENRAKGKRRVARLAKLATKPRTAWTKWEERFYRGIKK